MIDTTDASPVESAEPLRVVDYPRRKRRIILQLLAYCAVVGVVSVFLPDEDALLDLILRLPPLFLAVAWCFADAAERGHRIGRLTKVLLVLVLIVGLPSISSRLGVSGDLKRLGMCS